MSGKVTKIVLECDALHTKKEFSVSHAERLLQLRNNGGWKLPEDSPFEFVDNGIRVRENKKRNIRTKETGDDKQSD